MIIPQYRARPKCRPPPPILAHVRTSTTGPILAHVRTSTTGRVTTGTVQRGNSTGTVQRGDSTGTMKRDNLTGAVKRGNSPTRAPPPKKYPRVISPPRHMQHRNLGGSVDHLRRPVSPTRPPTKAVFEQGYDIIRDIYPNDKVSDTGTAERSSPKFIEARGSVGKLFGYI